MNKNTSKLSANEPFEAFSHSVSLFRLLGIEVRLDFSVVIIIMLIVFSLGSGVFAYWHPDWSPITIWAVALSAGLLFFVSLLAHEFSHSMVSRYYGIPVLRITLFLFGGMAQMSSEPDRPKQEFWIAIAGPLMSIFISLVWPRTHSDKTSYGFAPAPVTCPQKVLPTSRGQLTKGQPDS